MSKVNSVLSISKQDRLPTGNRILIVYELPVLLTDTVTLAEQSSESNAVISCQYWLCDKQGQLLQEGRLSDLQDVVELAPLAHSSSTYFIFSASQLYIDSVTVPGKLNSAITQSLKYQVETELASDMALLHTHLLDKTGDEVTFALIEQTRLDRYLLAFEQASIKLSGIFADAVFLPYSDSTISVYCDAHSPWTLWRFGQWDFATLPLNMIPFLLKSKLRSRSNPLDGSNQEEVENHNKPKEQDKSENSVESLSPESAQATLSLQPYTPNKQTTKPIIQPYLTSIGHEVIIHDDIDMPFYQLCIDWLAVNPPKKHRHLNFLPPNYQTKQKKHLTGPVKRLLTASLMVLGLFLVYQGVELISLNQQLQAKSQALIRYHNSVFQTQFKVLGQVSADLKSRLKSAGTTEPTAHSLFHWYDKLPTIFDAKAIKENQITVLQMRFNREQKELRISVQANSHQLLNQLKTKAKTEFILIDAPVTERNEKIETVLILQLPSQ